MEYIYKQTSKNLPFNEILDAFQTRLYQKLVEIAALKERRIKQALNGEVYKVQSGRARRGVYSSVSRNNNNFILKIGNNVGYAYTLEFGKKGPETVKAHKRSIVQAFGHQLKSSVTVDVKSHTRNVDRPGKSFIFANTKDVPNLVGAAIHQLVKEI